MRHLLAGVFALCLAFATTAFGQGLTSSTISGVVTDTAGKPVTGATVTVFYAPTNTTSTTIANAAGRFNFSGLPVGGPYTITATSSGFKSKEEKDVNLDLSQVHRADFSLEGTSEIVKMEAFVTSASANTLFDSLTTGSGSQIAQLQIDTTPTIARTINEFARLDPRVVITDRTNGETSAAGQNHRYNSMLIDGVKSNDVFGISSNGLPSQGNPISLDVIQAFDVEVSPYDVKQSGFTGAAINSVTKSGTNEFHGSVKYLWTNQNARAKNEDVTSVLYGKREVFSEKTTSATFGGPILKDKLFFFLGYEKFKNVQPPPSAGFVPSDAAIALIQSTFKSYGYDVGQFQAAGSLQKYDTKYFAKLDWNINSQHRLSYRYNKTDGQAPIFQDFSGSNSTSFSNHWYTNHQLFESHLVSLFSTWSPDFSTEVRASYGQYKTDRLLAGPDFPQVVMIGVPSSVTGASTGAVFVGTENSSANNHLKVDDYNLTINNTYLWGDHTLEFGLDLERSNFFDIFLQSLDGAYGTATGTTTAGYQYSQLAGAGGITGQPISYFYQFNPTGGTINQAYTINNFDRKALYLQDRWRFSPSLTFTAALRADRYSTPKPGYNAAASTAFGIDNSNSLDGLTSVSPRVGFNWAVDAEKKTQVRGGVGVFLGQGPGVWIANNYFNNGLSSISVSKPILASQGITNIPFQPDPTKQLRGTIPTFTINAMDSNFKLPTSLKSNIAIDRKLPWLGMTFTIEFNDTKVLESTWYQDLNLKVIGTTPDGRTLYGGAGNRVNAGYGTVFVMKNTKNGDARQTTLKLNKPWRDHWFGSVSYTYGTSTDVSPITSSTAGSNFGGRIQYNNDESAGRSNYEVRHRAFASVGRDWNLLKGYRTITSFQFEARSGRPYSYVYFSSDVNGDAANQNNDLFYVPTGPNDPKVRWASQTASDNFFAWLAGNGDLAKYAGKVVPRNSSNSKFIHLLDFHLSQEIPIWRNVKGELFYDIINLGNLLNSHWGRISQVGFPYNYTVASATVDTVANQYVYNFTGTPSGQRMQADTSRWQMQGGVQIKF